MSLKVFTKLFVLVSALSATILAIYWLKMGHMNAFWASLGFKQGTLVNWCEERVGTLYIVSSQAKLTEKDGEWLWVEGEKTKELDYLRVEKWFAKYCQVPYIPVDKVTTDKDRLIFEAQFIDGNRMSVFKKGGEDIFVIRGQVFRSETLRQALKELMAFGENFGYQ